jgi:hypothetical protein
MLFALILAGAVPTVPRPPRTTVLVHARIINGKRINLHDPRQKPVEAVIRKGLIEFP